MSIRLRLTLWYSAIVAFTFIVCGFAVYWFVAQNIYGDLKSKIVAQASQRPFDVNIDFWNGSFELRVGKFISQEFFVQTVNYLNANIQTSANLKPFHFPYPQKNSKAIQAFQHVTVEGAPFLIYNMPLTSNNQVVGLVQIGVLSVKEELLLAKLKNILTGVSILALMIAFSLGLFLARKSLKPIDNVIRAANQIESGTDLSVRIKREGPNDEIGRLVDTVNSMLSRMETFYNELDDAYKTQRRFVSDASHELRTPLTTIRGNVDLLEKMWEPNPLQESRWDEETLKNMSAEAIRDIADEAKRMSRLVNDLLALARADAGFTMEMEQLELKPIVEEVARRAQFLQRKAEWITGDFSSLEGIFVNGQKEYLQQMLFIFIENAFKFTPEGSVTIDTVRHGDQIGIRIADTGIGMDREQVPHIFDRFYRADESRGKIAGTGLGLSIAKWIIDEHKGSVEVLTTLGKGTTFIVWLPIASLPALE